MENKDLNIIERYLFDESDGYDPKINAWVKTHLLGYLKKNPNENPDHIDHVIDYLNSPQCSKKITRLGYSQAKRLSIAWTVALNKKKLLSEFSQENVDIKTIKTVSYENKKYSLVELISEGAYKKEGAEMQHCVASYFNRQQSRIYSIRSENNQSHVTIEVNISKSNPENQTIVQVKGKQNDDPIFKYQLILRMLLSHFFEGNENFKIDRRAANNVGIRYINHKLCDTIGSLPPKEIEISSIGDNKNKIQSQINTEYLSGILFWLKESNISINIPNFKISTGSILENQKISIKNDSTDISLDKNFKTSSINFEKVKNLSISKSFYWEEVTPNSNIFTNNSVNPSDKLSIHTYIEESWDDVDQDAVMPELNNIEPESIIFENEVELNTNHLFIENSIFKNEKIINANILEININSIEELQNLVALKNTKFKSIIINSKKILWKHIHNLSINIECDVLVLTEHNANLKDFIKHKELHISN